MPLYVYPIQWSQLPKSRSFVLSVVLEYTEIHSEGISTNVCCANERIFAWSSGQSASLALLQLPAHP